jgi:hypothetical protein
MKPFFMALACATLTIPTPTHAGEVFGGFYVHDVDTGLTRSGIEEGVDLEIGWRGERIGS